MRIAAALSYAMLFAFFSLSTVQSNVAERDFVPAINHCFGTSLNYDGQSIDLTCSAR